MRWQVAVQPIDSHTMHPFKAQLDVLRVYLPKGTVALPLKVLEQIADTLGHEPTRLRSV